MEALRHYLIPYLISNLAAIIILFTAFKKPKLARLLFVLLFGWACWLNYSYVHQKPQDYLEYAELAIPMYRDFINGWFKNHISIMVTLIAYGQGFIALGMILNNWWVKLACVGSIVFFLSISPLGIGAAIPFPLITAMAAYLILKNDDFNYLWNFRNLSKTNTFSSV